MSKSDNGDTEPYKKLSNKELQEKFNDTSLIARTVVIRSPDFKSLAKEVEVLNTLPEKEGVHKNVNRPGLRNRSSTLLVPGVRHNLYSSIGLLCDADKSTTRAYMYHDSFTQSPKKHGHFYNINIDKHKFVPTLSRQEFAQEYAKRNANSPEGAAYNEILSNFVPESVIALVAVDDREQNKYKLLEAKHFMLEKMHKDLPMTILDHGKIKTWDPNLAEIADLLWYKQQDIRQDKKKSPEEQLQQVKGFAKTLGYSVDNISDINRDINTNDVTLLNKNQVTAKDAIKDAREKLGLPDNDENNARINEALLKTVNDRREKEGEELIKNLKNAIIPKQDVDDLVKSEQRSMNPELYTEIKSEPSAAELTKLDRNDRLKKQAKLFATPPKTNKGTEYIGSPDDDTQGSYKLADPQPEPKIYTPEEIAVRSRKNKDKKYEPAKVWESTLTKEEQSERDAKIERLCLTEEEKLERDAKLYELSIQSRDVLQNHMKDRATTLAPKRNQPKTTKKPRPLDDTGYTNL